MISERYKIINEIGRGAMGTVYLSFDPVLARNLALKELALPEGVPQSEREYKVRRFLREARAAGRLSHPSIVTVHDITEDGGKYYIAMEYLEGETLRHLISNGPVPVEKAVDIAGQICDALHYAHDHDVVHRDVKPDNIFILKDGRVKITDFGIARILTDTTMTRAGAVIGSPGYMSPEQVMGGKIDRRTDIFALGAIIYEMLTAKNPFAGETITTIMYKIINEEPPALSSLPGQFSEGLDRVIKKAIAKEPGERFASADELKKELLEATSGKGTAEEAPSVPISAIAAATPPPAPASTKPTVVAERPTKQGTSRLRVGLAVVAAAVLLLLASRCVFAPRFIRAIKKLAAARQEKNRPASTQDSTFKPLPEKQENPVSPEQKQPFQPQQPQTQVKIEKVPPNEIEAFASGAQLLPSGVSASSVQPDAEGGRKFEAANAFDRKKETAWAGAAPNYGIGDVVEAKFNEAVSLDGLGLIISTKETNWTAIPRPKLFKVELSNSIIFDLFLEDRPGLQAFSLSSSQSIKTDVIRLKIVEIYPPAAGKPLLKNPPIAEIYLRGQSN